LYFLKAVCINVAAGRYTQYVEHDNKNKKYNQKYKLLRMEEYKNMQ